ncbi:MAG: hypothetical protein ACI89G_001791 [Minisyncoccia bacterium]|jgi:hypothetical protein
MCDRSMVYRSHRAPFELTRPAVRCGGVWWGGVRFGFEGRNTADVGFDPNRPYNAKPFDYALVVVCLAAAIGLLGWAFFG